jgi:hypothetical protein
MRRRTDALAAAGLIAGGLVLFVLFGLCVLAPVSWQLAVWIHYHINH